MAVTREVDMNPSSTPSPSRGAIARGRTRARRGSCGVAAGLALAVTAVVAACGQDRILDPHDDDVAALARAIVSNPVPDVRGTGTALSGATAGEEAVAYVSLPPGSLPDGEHVTIRNRRSGADAATAMWDGGFDPVAVEAAVGDTLDLEFRLAGSGGPVHVSHIVPLSRGPVVVRTDPPPRRRDVPLNALLAIVFSEPIDPQSVTTESVRLLRDGSPVSGAVALVPGSPFRVELAPDELLEPLTDYVLVVTTEVHDLDGDALAEDLRVEFTTATASATPVAISMVSGNHQQGKAGLTLTDPLVVRVTDAHGRGVEGVRVTWTVASGAGDLWSQFDGETYLCDSIDGCTDERGYSYVTFHPTTTGTLTVTAEVAGLTGSSVTFTTDVPVAVILFGEDWSGPSDHYPLVFMFPGRTSGLTVPVGTPVEWINGGTGVALWAGASLVSTSVPPGGEPFEADLSFNNGQPSLRFTPAVPGTWEFVEYESGATGTLTAQ